MIRIAIITTGFIISVLMMAVTHWFEIEQTKVERINQEHLSEIRRLRKIAQINKWLDRVVKPSLAALPKNETLSEASLVAFYDKYANDLNFEVEKYIYSDENSHNMDIKFNVERTDKVSLEKLMNLKYKSGFLRFARFKLEKKAVAGSLQLVQPYYGDNNASHD